MNCVLCAANTEFGAPVRDAVFIIDGASLCADCGTQVVASYRSPYTKTADIWWDMNDRFHALATIKARREKQES